MSRRRLGAVAFWGLTALVLGYNFPYFQVLQHANELPRIFMTLAMVEEGRYAIDTYRQAFGYRKAMDISRSHCLAPRIQRALHRGLRRPGPPPRPQCREHYFANKAPGMSVLAVPVYAALRWIWKKQGREPDLRRVGSAPERQRRLRVITRWVRLCTAGLPAFLFLLLLGYWLREYVPETHPRRVVVLAYGLGTLAFTYSVQFMSHQLAASLCFSAFILTHLVARRGARSWLLLPAGFLGGAALASDYQLIFAAVPLAVYALWVVRPIHRLVWAVLGAVAPLFLLLHYHATAYGSVAWTGYEFLVARDDAALHARGLLGITTPTWEAFWGSFFRPDNGLFYFSPHLLIALGGLPLLWRARRGSLPPAELWFMVAVIGIYGYFISSVAFWRGGWQTGPRYIAAMLPCLTLPFALLVRRVAGRPFRWALVVGPALAGIGIYALIVTTFPHFPEKYKWPLFDLVGTLHREGYACYNLGQLIGLKGRASLIPYLVALLGLVGYLAVGPISFRRFLPGAGRRCLAGVLAACAAVAVVGAYRHQAAQGLRRERAALARARARRVARLDYDAFLRRSRAFIRKHWEPPSPKNRARRPGRRRRFRPRR